MIRVGIAMSVATFALALIAAATASAAAESAQAAPPKAWYWSKERAAKVAFVPDPPKGCSQAIYKSGWIGKCVAPNYTYGGPECDGVGKRIISSTDDVYLYNKFTCGFAIRRWTPAALNAAWQHMAELACENQKNDAAAYDACQQAALKDRVNIKTGGFGGTGLWLTDAAKRETSTLRVQVTGRFTAIVTWLGQSWKMTIHPTG
jgi:hypothetical protein